MIFDYLVIGQGIAGTTLSHQLMKLGRSVFIIDKYVPNSSSNIAAGIFNPVTGRKMVKTWLADTLFPATENTFKELEQFLGEEFYFPKNIYRPFTNIREQNDWYATSEKEDIKPYIAQNPDNENLKQYINNSFGGSELTISGNVDVAKFIDAYRKVFVHKGIISDESFDYEFLQIEENLITYKDIKAKRIIFCEGSKAIDNPWFNYLPFVLAKGEILTIEIEGADIDKIVSKGIFILPIGNNKYKVGSTYNWADLSDNPTEQALKDLAEKLDAILKVPYKIVGHTAGIRPTVKDRRPFIGLHPEYKNVGIFNGLGTKGVALSAYFSKHFAEHLELGKELMPEADIKRFA